MKLVKLNMRVLLLASLAMLVSLNANAGNRISYVINDHLGTPQIMVDQNKAVVWKANYDAYGNADIVVNQVELNVRFPGQYYDKETGLYYNYYRDYDPSLGRYVQSDPIGLAGGINTYGYVGGNPLTYIDPFGLLSKEAQDIVDAAMDANGNNTEDAYNSIALIRFGGNEENIYDTACRDAEHYMFARDWTASTNGLAGFSLIPATAGYSTAKVIAGDIAQPGGIWDTTEPSWSELFAGFEGVMDGFLDLVSQL